MKVWTTDAEQCRQILSLAFNFDGTLLFSVERESDRMTFRFAAR